MCVKAGVGVPTVWQRGCEDKTRQRDPDIATLYRSPQRSKLANASVSQAEPDRLVKHRITADNKQKRTGGRNWPHLGLEGKTRIWHIRGAGTQTRTRSLKVDGVPRQVHRRKWSMQCCAQSTKSRCKILRNRRVRVRGQQKNSGVISQIFSSRTKGVVPRNEIGSTAPLRKCRSALLQYHPPPGNINAWMLA